MQHAIWNNDEVTGATTFRIVKELDAGPTFGVMTERIRPDDTSGDLLERLAEGGAGLLVATLDGIEDGSLDARPQQAEGVSFAPKILVDDARVDWTRPAIAVDCQVRACTPAPGAWTTYAGERVKLGPVTLTEQQLAPGVLEVGQEPRAGRHRHPRRTPRRRAGARQEADGGRRLGARAAPRGRRRFRCPLSRSAAAVDPARRVAFEVLKAVRVDDAYTNLVLPALLREEGLSGRDAAFATELASGTIRWQGTYDAILAACIDRQLSKVESKVLDALRLGTHQLLAMRVPTHAAISTTVDLVRFRVSSGAAGFANAVLRKVSAQDLTAWVAQVAPDPAHRLQPPGLGRRRAARRARPRRRARGAAGRRQRAARRSPSSPGRDAPRARSCRGSRPRSRRTASCWRAATPGSCRRSSKGRAGVQDEGSQLVAIAAAAAPVDGADARWLDLCAGPGGKAALLAALAAQRGAGLVASERQQHRAVLVKRALRRAPASPGS